MDFVTKRREAMELADLLNTRRRELLDTIGELNKAITACVELADRYLPDAVDEGLGGAKVTKLKYQTHSPSPADVAAFTKPSFRKCSLCGEMGHNARTCTNPKAPMFRQPERKTHERHR